MRHAFVVLTVVALLLCYAPTLRGMFEQWSNDEDDTTLVRVIVWPADGRDEAAATVAIGFARELYPLMRAYLPL